MLKFIEMLRNLCLMIASIVVLMVIGAGILTTNSEIKFMGQISVTFMSIALVLSLVKHYATTITKDSTM